MEHVAPLLDAFADDVVDALGRAGVQPLEVEVGERVDLGRHRQLKEMAVDDAARADTVVEVLAVGFVSGDRVVKRADVAVGHVESAKQDT